VGDVDIKSLLNFHKSHGKIATVTAIQPEARFGGMELDQQDKVMSFKEKPIGDGRWINGGFFVLEPSVFKYLEGDVDDIMWEEMPMDRLTKDGNLMAYKHLGFWKCMDALRDKLELEALWKNNTAKWKIW
jgi:glucose-1-phosphate cytidylyltransferase